MQTKLFIALTLFLLWLTVLRIAFHEKTSLFPSARKPSTSRATGLAGRAGNHSTIRTKPSISRRHHHARSSSTIVDDVSPFDYSELNISARAIAGTSHMLMETLNASQNVKASLVRGVPSLSGELDLVIDVVPPPVAYSELPSTTSSTFGTSALSTTSTVQPPVPVYPSGTSSTASHPKTIVTSGAARNKTVGWSVATHSTPISPRTIASRHISSLILYSLESHSPNPGTPIRRTGSTPCATPSPVSLSFPVGSPSPASATSQTAVTPSATPGFLSSSLASLQINSSTSPRPSTPTPQPPSMTLHSWWNLTVTGSVFTPTTAPLYTPTSSTILRPNCTSCSASSTHSARWNHSLSAMPTPYAPGSSRQWRMGNHSTTSASSLTTLQSNCTSLSASSTRSAVWNHSLSALPTPYAPGSSRHWRMGNHSTTSASSFSTLLSLSDHTTLTSMSASEMSTTKPPATTSQVASGPTTWGQTVTTLIDVKSQTPVSAAPTTEAWASQPSAVASGGVPAPAYTGAASAVRPRMSWLLAVMVGIAYY